MNPIIRRPARRLLAAVALGCAPALLLAVGPASPAPCRAQDGGGASAAPGAPTGAKQGPGGMGGASFGVSQPLPNITLDLDGTPLSQALALLFQSAGLSYTLPQDLRNVPVTLKLKDADFTAALRTLLKAGSAEDLHLQYSVENGVYRIDARRPFPAPEPVATMNVVPINNIRAGVALEAIRPLFPNNAMTASSADNTIVFQGTPDELAALHAALRSVDVTPRAFELHAAVIQVNAAGVRKVLTMATIRTTQGNEATLDEENDSAIPAQAMRFVIHLTPQRVGDGTILVTSRWDARLPLMVHDAANRPITIWLEKRLGATTNLTPNKTAVVGEVAGGQWGGSGKIVFELTAHSM
jgi:hypothetical protein